MEETLKTLIESYSLSAFQVALISIGVSILTFIISNWAKNHFANKLVKRNLETEHIFEQQKKIKEVLAKYKVQLIRASEDLSRRISNFTNKHQEKWLHVKGDYLNEHYYFHSFTYRFLVLFAWTKKIQKDMIYLDTTIASKDDLEFIKFLNVFPRLLCDLTFLEGIHADGNQTDDHFYRNTFELLPDVIITKEGVNSYSKYVESLNNNSDKLSKLFEFFDCLSPNEERKRWDRIQFLFITLIAFLNSYGYDFQVTNEEKINKALTKPKTSQHLDNYFELITEYHLINNSEISKIKKIAEEIKKSR